MRRISFKLAEAFEVREVESVHDHGPEVLGENIEARLYSPRDLCWVLPRGSESRIQAA